MGSFHCPMGAVYYEDDDCIDCGMCIASNKEEMIEATKRVRAYLQQNRKTDAPVAKIAVTGKGGVGKSSTTALMTNILKEKGYKIAVLDTDESNPGLHRKLGLEKEPMPLMTALNGSGIEKKDADMVWINAETISLQDIPSIFKEEKDDMSFLISGKIDDPFQGCACSIADLSKKFVARLSLNSEELLVVDMEAGIESFGRGVERSVDTILIIVEPSYDSLILAEKIFYMAQGMGIRRVRALLNKIPSEKVQKRIAEELKNKNIPVIGTVFFDLELNEAGFEGRALPDSEATDQMREAINTLLNADVAA